MDNIKEQRAKLDWICDGYINQADIDAAIKLFVVDKNDAPYDCKFYVSSAKRQEQE